jgi:hypothetical protein
MCKIVSLLLVGLLSFMLVGTVSAQQKDSKTEKKDKPKEVTIVGQVIDSECYMKMGDMALGEDHHNCAEACAKGGIPLAILEDKTNNVYFTANEGMSMKSTTEKLMPFLDEKVSIKGKLIERGGAKLLVISAIEKTK